MYREMAFQQERLKDMAHEAQEERMRRDAQIDRARPLKTVRTTLGRSLIVIGQVLIST